MTVTLFSSILNSHYLPSHFLSHFCQYIAMYVAKNAQKLLHYAHIVLNAHGYALMLV